MNWDAKIYAGITKTAENVPKQCKQPYIGVKWSIYCSLSFYREYANYFILDISSCLWLVAKCFFLNLLFQTRSAKRNPSIYIMICFSSKFILGMSLPTTSDAYDPFDVKWFFSKIPKFAQVRNVTPQCSSILFLTFFFPYIVSTFSLLITNLKVGAKRKFLKDCKIFGF